MNEKKSTRNEDRENIIIFTILALLIAVSFFYQYERI